MTSHAGLGLRQRLAAQHLDRLVVERRGRRGSARHGRGWCRDRAPRRRSRRCPGTACLMARTARQHQVVGSQRLARRPATSCAAGTTREHGDRRDAELGGASPTASTSASIDRRSTPGIERYLGSLRPRRHGRTPARSGRRRRGASRRRGGATSRRRGCGACARSGTGRGRRGEGSPEPFGERMAQPGGAELRCRHGGSGRCGWVQPESRPIPGGRPAIGRDAGARPARWPPGRRTLSAVKRARRRTRGTLLRRLGLRRGVERLVEVGRGCRRYARCRPTGAHSRR